MTDDVIAVLVAETDRVIQLELLRTVGISLDDVLQAAKERLQTHPAAARTLLELCDQIPQATYLLAQTYAQAGDYQAAHPIILEARQQFLAADQPTEAWRTTVGEMMVLSALGRSADALAAADNALGALGDTAPLVRGKLYQNQGLIHEQRGDFTAAFESYDAATLAFEMGGHANEQCDILKNRGVTLLSLGAAQDALRAFERAAELVNENDQPIRRGRTLFNIGYAHMLLGNYDDSLAAFKSARSLLQQPDYEQFALMVELDSADLYQTLNRTDDAITAYARAYTGLKNRGMAYHAARALFGWGIALCAGQQFDESAEKLTAAQSAFTALENQTLVQRIQVEQASLQLKQGNGDAALAAVTELLRENDLSDQTHFVALLIQADATADQSLKQDALTAASAIADKLPLPHLRYRVLQRQGQLAAALGDVDAAENLFDQAIEIVETLRGNLQQESLRISFLHDRLTAHRELMRLLIDQARIGEAWQLGEQIKSRTLTEAQQNANAASAKPIEIDNLRQELDALYNMLLDEHGEARRVQQTGTLRQRVLQLEKEIQQRYPPLVPPRQATTHVAATIDSTTAQITYHLLGEELIAFVQSGTELRLVRDVAAWADVVEGLAAWDVQVRWMGGAQRILAHRADQMAFHARRVLQQLYTLLFAPLRPLVDGCESLLIVPTELLHSLPFHALHDGERYLVEQYTLRYAPSVTVDQLAKKGAAPDYQHVAAFGVDDPALAHVATELTAIGEQFSTAETYHNATASRHAVAETNAPILHFATHGIFRSEHPLFSGLRLHDGWMTAHDVARLNFDNRLIVLSACESGRTQLATGDEVLGLPHAFLGAGARSVIASQWLVQDEVSAELMPAFYRQLHTTHNPALALRLAQLEMAERRPHPYYWANFVLFGGSVR